MNHSRTPSGLVLTDEQSARALRDLITDCVRNVLRAELGAASAMAERPLVAAASAVTDEEGAYLARLRTKARAAKSRRQRR
jgi:hypothetical protein